MRDNVRAFVEIATKVFGLGGPVYEFGSYQVEGQRERADLRPLFAGQRYVGCDMRPGPGVDRVEDLARLKLANETAQTILCIETLEHVFEVRRAIDEMLRVLAPGGAILITVPLDFPLHDYPSDYWRLTPSCLSRLLAPLGATIVGWQGVEEYPHTVFGLGIKAPVDDRFAGGAKRLVNQMETWLALAELQVPWQRKLKQATIGRLRSKGERRRVRDWFRAEFLVQLPISASWKEAVMPPPAEPSHLPPQASQFY
jgi:SAM-dependent methyltransferase